MIGALRRKISIYSAFAAMVPKTFLAYTIWVWMSLFTELVAMIIFVFFWQAVYADGGTIAGLDLQQTLNYILLARIFSALAYNTNVIYQFGRLVRQGEMAVVLLRPLDFQLSMYVNNIADLLLGFVLNIPLAIVAVVFFGLRVPLDPAIWGAFLISMILGHAVLFFFDWIIGCIAFYITEIWGLSVLRHGVAGFFSGSLVPLVMMPEGIRTVTESLPFAQALYVPVALLSGITPLADAPQVWAIQLVWLVVLGFLSRLVFNHAARKVTVQGG
jgi:ABC-2 type transport system permease protein